MFTLQHSPWILCADMLDQVNVEKDPALADLGTGDFTRTGFILQRDRMNLQELGGLEQGERVHGPISKSRPSRLPCRQRSRQSLWSR